MLNLAAALLLALLTLLEAFAMALLWVLSPSPAGEP